MKYLVYADWDPADMDEVIEKAMEFEKELEESPEKYPERLSAPYQVAGKCRGVIFQEGNEEQMINYASYYMPLVDIEFVPIVEFSKTVELWKKMGK